MTEIGKLTEVSPRVAWPNETQNLTPWLCDHLDQLGEVIGLQLEFEDREVSIQNFYADIIARNPVDDTRILIENQLEKSDHSHLGQIMTYLAGLEAHVIIWIASDFTEPHLAAIKWLNEHTAEPFAFFAIRLRVVKIGDSQLAPIFDVLERPNNWERQTQAEVRDRQSRLRRGQERAEFWSLFAEQHPELAARGIVYNGAASQWLLPTEVEGLVVSIYIALDRVGMFLRGPRGSSRSEVAQRFEPVREQFSKLVNDEISGGTEENYPYCSFSIDTRERKNWDEAIAWLAAKASLWLQATSNVFGQD